MAQLIRKADTRFARPLPPSATSICAPLPPGYSFYGYRCLAVQAAMIPCTGLLHQLLVGLAVQGSMLIPFITPSLALRHSLWLMPCFGHVGGTWHNSWESTAAWRAETARSQTGSRMRDSTPPSREFWRCHPPLTSQPSCTATCAPSPCGHTAWKRKQRYGRARQASLDCTSCKHATYLGALEQESQRATPIGRMKACCHTRQMDRVQSYPVTGCWSAAAPACDMKGVKR